MDMNHASKQLRTLVVACSLAACGGGNGNEITDASLDGAKTDSTVDAGPTKKITVLIADLPTDLSQLVGLIVMYQDGNQAWQAAPLQPSFTFDARQAFVGVGIACQATAFDKRVTEIIYRTVAEGDRITITPPFRCRESAKNLVSITGQVEGYRIDVPNQELVGIRTSLRNARTFFDQLPTSLVSAPISLRVTPGNGLLGIVRKRVNGVDRAMILRGENANRPSNINYNFLASNTLDSRLQPFPPLAPGSFARVTVAFSTSPTDEILLDEVTSQSATAVSLAIPFVFGVQQDPTDFHTITLTALRDGEFVSGSLESKMPGTVAFPTQGAVTQTATRTATSGDITATWTTQSVAKEYSVALRQTVDDGTCAGDACQVELAARATPAWVAAAGTTWTSPDVSAIANFPARFNKAKPILVNIGASTDNGRLVGQGRTTRFLGLEKTLP